jgi:putative spermidine/putrescine transport system permease protein
MLLTLVPLLVWVGIFELAPLVRMISMSFGFGETDGFTFHYYVKALTTNLYTQAIGNSLQLALFSTLIALPIAIIACSAIVRLSEPARDRMLMLSNMTSNFVGVPLAFAYIIMLGNNGAFTLLFHKLGLSALASFDLYSDRGLLLLYVYYQIPLAILLIYPVFHAIKDEWKEAAALLGATNAAFWWRIGLPVMLPGILGTFSLLIANALGAYATAYALMGSNANLLAIRIAGMVSGDIFPNFSLASALAVILAVIMLMAQFINERLARRSRRRGI